MIGSRFEGRGSRWLWALAVLAVLTGCEHKDLCYHHAEHATRYRTEVRADYELIWEMPEEGGYDWESGWPSWLGVEYSSLNPSTPEGMCVSSYSAGGQNSSRHLPPDGGVVDMAPGINSLLMYNDDTEYIIFDNMNNSVSAKASTRVRSRAGYRGNTLNPLYSTVTEKTITPPDALFGYYADEYEQRPAVEPTVLDVTLRPLVFSYYVRYEFARGVEYVGVARGALSGMAESVFLFDGHTGKEQATILYDCTVHDWGVEAVVNTFGVPDYPNTSYSRSGVFYGLNLEVRLKNGKLLQFDYDITNLIATQPHGGVVVVSGLEIDDEIGKADGSGFDVDVDDWGEYEDVVIDL